MAVKYKGEVPERKFSLKDFRNNGVDLHWCTKFRSSNNELSIRAVFKSNGLLGEIRTTCYGDSFAVDVRWGWWTSEQRCLTTECKTMQEAKSILFVWFRSRGFAKSKSQVDYNWSARYLRYD